MGAQYDSYPPSVDDFISGQGPGDVGTSPHALCVAPSNPHYPCTGTAHEITIRQDHSVQDTSRSWETVPTGGSISVGTFTICWTRHRLTQPSSAIRRSSTNGSSRRSRSLRHGMLVDLRSLAPLRSCRWLDSFLGEFVGSTRGRHSSRELHG